MNRILVTGACGQIGSELVPELRNKYGAENVVASGHITTPSEDIKNGGPYIEVDVTNYEEINESIKHHKIDTVYHLASILSALAESKRRIAYEVNLRCFLHCKYFCCKFYSRWMCYICHCSLTVICAVKDQ